MRTKFFKLFLLITFLFLSNADLLAQVNWTKYPGNPVLTGQPGTWYAYTTMNSVLYNADSSRYEMWFTAGAQVEFPYTIGFAKSVDGITWEVYSPNPVLTPTSGSWDAYMVLAPYVIRENGQYKMWYTGCQTNSLLFRIGYATSLDGINWTKHPSNPIFLPGTASWESAAVAYPCIMPYSGGYKMWYGGSNPNWSVTGIGYATSPDGITWERYTGNPVLSPGATGQWDHVLFAPRVLFIDNNYYMFYSGETVVYQSDKIGLATSPNGLVWTKYPFNPILKPTAGQWDGDRTNSGFVLLDAGTLKMYYCGMPVGATNMQLGMATSVFSPPLLPGTYTIGTGGNFATIQDAFNKLETDGVAGNVTLELIDELYTAPTGQYGFRLNGPIPGAGPNSRVTIKPAENKNVVVQHNGSAVYYLINTSYLNFDGISTNGSTSLTVQALHNTAYPYNEGILFMNNSDHNVIQNITFLIEDYLRESGFGFWSEQAGTAADSNLIQNNFVKKAGFSLYIYNTGTGVVGKGNIIRGNQIGSETDSLVAYGIQVNHCENTLIENNIIQNLRLTFPGVGKGQVGIATVFGSGNIIRNNVIKNLRGTAGSFACGIFLLGLSGIYGNNNFAYNNMIFDINSTSIQSDSKVAGIQIQNQNNPKIYYNSVYLSGIGTNKYGSAALYITNNVTNADVKNNIFVNTRDEGQYCASAIYDYTASNLISDYNDLYYDNTNSYNCLVKIGGTKYNTLTDWQATGKDLHSYVEMPHFISSTNLHIDETVATYLESRGTPIAGINLDFDGQPRHATTPDIGADEFNGTPVGVEDEETLPTEYALEQNYPNPFNPSTKISWQSPLGSHQTIKVFDVLGNEIATLVDEYKPAGRYEVEFNAVSLPSGVYFYQLKAGEYISTKKMILLK